jgi:hypothetical protein
VRFPRLKPVQSKSRPGTWVVSVPASISESGKKESPTFRSRNAALEWATRFKDERLGKKAATVSDEEKEALTHFRQHVGDLKLMPEVVRHWLATSRVAIKPVTVAVVVDGFLVWRPTHGQWSRSTAEDTAGRLKIFAQALGSRLIHELTPADVERFLAVRGEAGTRVKFFNKLRPLFRYAKRQRFLAIDPMEELTAPRLEYREIEIYTAEELQRMLTVAEKTRPEFVPFLALMAFGFLRTEEIITRFPGDSVLDWKAFDWIDRQIFVPHLVAKKARNHGGNDRAVPFNDALLHWLEPYVKPLGQIITLRKLAAFRALKKIRTKADVRDLSNGWRHSCISYWMAANGAESLGTISRWSGNSPAICKRHYLATLKRAQGEAWFAVRRDTCK